MKFKIQKKGSWYYLYVKKYLFWRKCGYGQVSELVLKESQKKYEDGTYPLPDLAITKYLKLIPVMFKNAWLCWKYPFLYPRNRFSDKHYNNWEFADRLNKMYSNAYKLEGLKEKRKSLGWAIIYHTLKWIYDHPIQWLHVSFGYTELDAMPDGWRKAFGIQMCQELRETLLKEGGYKFLRSYRILQVKEKYGELRWYCHPGTHEIYNVINKYEELSRNTCIICGEPAKYRTISWINPVCEKHLPEYNRDCGDFEVINYG